MIKCIHCTEEIKPEDRSHEYANGPLAHEECFLRGIIGSVAHLQRRCSCYVPGSTESDPVGMTPREAARAAVTLWRSQRHDDEHLSSSKQCNQPNDPRSALTLTRANARPAKKVIQ